MVDEPEFDCEDGGAALAGVKKEAPPLERKELELSGVKKEDGLPSRSESEITYRCREAADDGNANGGGEPGV